MGGLLGIEEDMKEKQHGFVCHVNMICMIYSGVFKIEMNVVLPLFSPIDIGPGSIPNILTKPHMAMTQNLEVG